MFNLSNENHYFNPALSFEDAIYWAERLIELGEPVIYIFSQNGELLHTMRRGL